MEFALLVLRLAVGLYFVAHGAQKLFGAFGGHGLAGTAGFFESIGLRPGRFHATAAGVNEFAGGALIALGLLTPLGALLIVATMVGAYLTVHRSNGPFQTENGYELNLIYGAAAVALAGTGPGDWSLDNLIGLDLDGTWYAVGVLVLGVVGGFLTIQSSKGGAPSSAGEASA